MGYYDEVDDRWSFSSKKHVCPGCIEDETLAACISEAASSALCDYCGQRSKDGKPIAAPVQSLLRRVVAGIETEYTDPANELPYESAEGGYLGEVLDGWDILEKIDTITVNDVLYDDIRSAISDTHWCRRNYYALRRDELLYFSWGTFEEAVKHRSRYFFMESLKKKAVWNEEEIPPAEMLSVIAQVVQDARLLRRIAAGTSYYRARVHSPSESPDTCGALGPPPTDKARFPNRMSPAGISMFYGAEERETAEAEVLDPERTTPAVVTSAAFSTLRPLRILDLASIPEIPSIFDETQAHLRRDFMFLADFAQDVCKPIKKDGREHIEYVPTQIVTEYFRSVFKVELRTRAGRRRYRRGIDGIRYRSVQRPGGTCVVIFAEEENCCDAGIGLAYPEGMLMAFNASTLLHRKVGDAST